jgi:ferredoxin
MEAAGWFQANTARLLNPRLRGIPIMLSFGGGADAASTLRRLGTVSSVGMRVKSLQSLSSRDRSVAKPTEHALARHLHKAFRIPWSGRLGVAYKIIGSRCTSCSICEFECPNAAISEKGGVFVINPKKCTECDGHFDQPRCAELCPVENTCVPA